MEQDFYKKIPGLIRRSCRKGYRYLLEGKSETGDRCFVTVPLTESDSTRTVQNKIATARTQLDKKCHPPKDVNKYIDLYAAQHGLKASTIVNYRNSLKHFSIENAAVNTEAMNALITSDRKRSTVHHAVSRIRGFFNWLTTQGFDIPNPAVGIKIKNPDQPRTRIPTDEEVNRVKQWAIKREHTYPGSKLYVGLIIATGARHSTIAAIRAGDLHADNRAYLTNIKCDKAYDVAIPIDKNLAKLWRDAAAGKSPADRIFEPMQAERIHKSLGSFMSSHFGADANGERISPHSFRHRVATLMLQAGVPIDTIAKVLDHKSIATTLHAYARHSQDQIDAAFSTLK